MREIKAIVFDFDGVIAESVNVKTEAFAALFESYGKDVVGQVVEYHLINGGVSRFEKIRYYYKNILQKPLSEEELDKLCDRFSNIVVDKVVNSPFVPGAKEFLEKYYQRYKFYVVSGTPQDELRQIVKRKNLERFFRKVMGSPRNKTELTKETLSQDNFDRNQVVFIGDAITDYEAACNTGIKFVGRVPKGQKNPFSKDILVIENLFGLENILGKLQM